MKQNSTKTLTHPHPQTNTRTLTHTYMYTDAYLRNCRCSFVRRFAFGLLCTTPQSTREFIKVCLPTRRESCLTQTHTHTHVYIQSHTYLEIDTAAISSYQEITTNLQVPHKCLTKSFWKAFTDFATSQRFLWYAREGWRRGGRGRGCVLAIDIYGPRCYRVDIS